MIKAFSTDLFVLPLPEGHRFPMDKYRQLRQTVSSWPDLEVLEPPRASDDVLTLVHQAEYVRGLCSGALSDAAMREIGFPWSPAMVERSRRSTGATMAAPRGSDGRRSGFYLAVNPPRLRRPRAGFCCFTMPR